MAHLGTLGTRDNQSSEIQRHRICMHQIAFGYNFLDGIWIRDDNSNECIVPPIDRENGKIFSVAKQIFNKNRGCLEFNAYFYDSSLNAWSDAPAVYLRFEEGVWFFSFEPPTKPYIHYWVPE